MNEPTEVSSFSTLQWPERPSDIGWSWSSSPMTDRRLLERTAQVTRLFLSWLGGFERLVEGVWPFPHLDGYTLGIFEEFDYLALIDETPSFCATR